MPLLQGAGIDPARAFFTNALMGLKDGLSVGSMKATAQFESECSQFLLERVNIVQSSAIVAFGNDAYKRARSISRAVIKCTHPSAREFVPLGSRASRVNAKAIELGAALNALKTRWRCQRATGGETIIVSGGV